MLYNRLKQLFFTMAQQRLEVINRHLKGRPTQIKTVQCSAPANSTIKFIDKEFRYTFNSPALSRDKKIFYENNGYLIIPDLFDEEFLDQCSERFIAICEGKAPRGNITMMKDLSLMKTGAKGQYLYNKLQDILHDEVFEKYFFDEKVVECFTGPNIQGIHSMLINKPPDSGNLTSRHPLHQDLYYFPLRPADRIVAAWTALEDTNSDNGCLFVIPGSHTGKLLPHAYPTWEGGVNKMYHGVKDYNPADLVNLPMRKGETVFFHPLLLHGSGPNITKGFRKAISCHFASLDCYYIDVKGTLQEELAEEILEVARKKTGYGDISFQILWQLRSRKIREQGKSCL